MSWSTIKGHSQGRDKDSVMKSTAPRWQFSEAGDPVSKRHQAKSVTGSTPGTEWVGTRDSVQDPQVTQNSLSGNDPAPNVHKVNV